MDKLENKEHSTGEGGPLGREDGHEGRENEGQWELEERAGTQADFSLPPTSNFINAGDCLKKSAYFILALYKTPPRTHMTQRNCGGTGGAVSTLAAPYQQDEPAGHDSVCEPQSH